MKMDYVDDVEDCAKRVLKCIDLYRDWYAHEKATTKMQDIVSSKERAALRRASLDLTRALAAMRCHP